MSLHHYRHWSPLLGDRDADAMMRIAEAFGSFGTYADEATSEGLGETLPQRFDVGFNYVQAGIDGAGNSDDIETAVSRTNYFRETYAYGSEVLAPGIETFMQLPQLGESARQLSACDLIEPAIVYANLLVPGQELAIHTDVPEFRGANRKNMPQWLLVCMLHSGLFNHWRIPILTCVSWWGSASGGAFTFYPDGPAGARQSIPAVNNSAILVDTDRIYHGVERVGQPLPDLPPIGQQTRLHFCGDGRWQLREGVSVLAEYEWHEIRYSISWKAYCFADKADCKRWQDGSDDISLIQAIDILERELRERGTLSGTRPGPDEFAKMMVDAFIQFPGATRSKNKTG